MARGKRRYVRIQPGGWDAQSIFCGCELQSENVSTGEKGATGKRETDLEWGKQQETRLKLLPDFG